MYVQIYIFFLAIKKNHLIEFEKLNKYPKYLIVSVYDYVFNL
jgi:hypothetical protein